MCACLGTAFCIHDFATHLAQQCRVFRTVSCSFTVLPRSWVMIGCHAVQVDLVDADRLAECSSLIRSINADATIQHTQQSSVNVTNLLNQGVYSQNAASATSSCAVQHLTAPALYHRADMSARGSREAESSTRLHIGNGDALHSSSSVPRPAQHATAVRHDTEVHSHNSRVSTMAIRPSGSVNLQRYAQAIT